MWTEETCSEWVKQFHWIERPQLFLPPPLSLLVLSGGFSCGAGVHQIVQIAGHRFHRQMAFLLYGCGCGWSNGLIARSSSCKFGTGMVSVQYGFACAWSVHQTLKTSLGRFQLGKHKVSHLVVSLSGHQWDWYALLSVKHYLLLQGDLSVQAYLVWQGNLAEMLSARATCPSLCQGTWG